MPFHDMMEDAKVQTHHNIFMELFIISSWSI
jgi:hypothetical protein